MINIDNDKRYFGIIDEAGVGRAAMVAAGMIQSLARVIHDLEFLQKMVGIAGVNDYTDQYDWAHKTVVTSLAEAGIETPYYNTRTANKRFADSSFIILSVCNPIMLPLFLKRHPNLFVHFVKDPPEHSKQSIDDARDELIPLASGIALSLLIGGIDRRNIKATNEIFGFRRYRLNDETHRDLLPVYSNTSELMSQYLDETAWMREEKPLFQVARY